MTFIATGRSSNITGVEYFEHAETLIVTFPSGAYGYRAALRAEVDALLTADSLGSHLAKVFRKQHPKFWKIVDTAEIDALRFEESEARILPYSPPPDPNGRAAAT
jgi:ABC-type amino acid transport substrate-binding protein